MLRTYKKFWRRYFDFKGRSRRSDYWWVFLINNIIYLVLTTIFLLSSGLSVALNADVDNFLALTWIALILLVVWGLASIVPMSALAMRRIRDTGLSPYLWLVFPASLILGEFTQVWAMIISTVLAIVYLIFTLLPSKPDKIKPDSQIKGSLIVTTGLLVLIIFSVGHLPAKAEQIAKLAPQTSIPTSMISGEPSSALKKVLEDDSVKESKQSVNGAKIITATDTDEENKVAGVEIENTKTGDSTTIVNTGTQLIITKSIYDKVTGKTKTEEQRYDINPPSSPIQLEAWTAWKYTNVAVGTSIFANVINGAVGTLVGLALPAALPGAVAGILGVSIFAAKMIIGTTVSTALGIFDVGGKLARSLDKNKNGWIAIYRRTNPSTGAAQWKTV
ncbi:DUF805 domain-containing protein [Lactococcus cremoris]|uniref:DUF805 domain-containing protein n=1 Tax=Lactococcus cremoris subsp. tructae TaxID=542833 RepID=A0A2A5SXK3_LACLC|nr:DUF805 domain-containing protein [Lactococcus cremoris]PCS20625.1 hypothetical protein RU92_GL000273 [Lactococcus cremoris subsp. tructae]